MNDNFLNAVESESKLLMSSQVTCTSFLS